MESREFKIGDWHRHDGSHESPVPENTVVDIMWFHNRAVGETHGIGGRRVDTREAGMTRIAWQNVCAFRVVKYPPRTRQRWVALRDDGDVVNLTGDPGDRCDVTTALLRWSDDGGVTVVEVRPCGS